MTALSVLPDPEVREWFAAIYPHTSTPRIAETFGISTAQAYRLADQLGLQKSEAYLRSEEAGRFVPGSGVGSHHRFTAGHKTWNAGMKGWKAGGRSVETQFQAGVRQGVAVKLYKAIGTERISKDGYLERKINDDMPLRKRWRAVHLLLWESHNGPIPAGHKVVFRNGDKRDIRIDNLEMISNAECMRRNTIHRMPKELREVCHLRGVIKAVITKRLKKESHGQH